MTLFALKQLAQRHLIILMMATGGTDKPLGPANREKMLVTAIIGQKPVPMLIQGRLLSKRHFHGESSEIIVNT
jgi:hypothetical protein